MMGDVITLDDFDAKTKGKEFEVMAYNYSASCESHTLVALRALKGKQRLTLDRNWCVFVRSGTPFLDDIPF